MKMPTLTACAVAALMMGPALAQDTSVQPEDTAAVVVRRSVTADEIMVASANPLASEVGLEVLRAGGSAADAAVAVQMMLNLVEPQSSGIGGGAFALYWNEALGELTTFDGRETAPAAATPEYWLDAEGAPRDFWDAVVGGRSVGVPGTLKLMDALHARYGRLPWRDLFDPTIEAADAGFPISLRLAASISGAQEQSLDLFAPTRAYFFDADGLPKEEGLLLKNPDFARTLRLIAAEGSDPFYFGSIARDIVATVDSDPNPGVMTLADLAAYEVIERGPVCVDYRGASVCGMGPPSSGGLTVGQILGMLSHFDLPTMGDTPAAAHLLAEASRLAFADRGVYMADSDFVDMPTAGLIDPGYLADRARLIDPSVAMEGASPGEPPWDDARLYAPDIERPRHGTSHFVVKDAYGDMISITTTIETGFGSRLMTGGFLLNNELTDFSFEPETDGKPVANRVEGGKRPRSSMSPTIVLRDGAPVLLIGSPGGSRIIGYVAGSLVGILDFGLDPQIAIDRPHVLNRNGATDVEEGPDGAALAAALTDLGHEVEVRDLNSGLHAIAISDAGLVGAADKRREGAAVGD